MHALDALKIAYETVALNGEDYIVTTGTGEIGFGSKGGGSGAFAYLADEVAEIKADDYADFCERAHPIGSSDDEWDALAVECARRGLRLTEAGACRPALNDREWTLVRMACE